VAELFQDYTELSESYRGKSLNLAAGIAKERDIAKPIKEASYFLLTTLRCYAAN
jgi:hypothetical protein